MVGRWPEPRYMPCTECGASVERTDAHEHACERERWLDFQMFRRRHDIAAVTDEVAAYLNSAEGKFELWYAERERRRLDEAA